MLDFAAINSKMSVHIIYKICYVFLDVEFCNPILVGV